MWVINNNLIATHLFIAVHDFLNSLYLSLAVKMQSIPIFTDIFLWTLAKRTPTCYEGVHNKGGWVGHFIFKK